MLLGEREPLLVARVARREDHEPPLSLAEGDLVDGLAPQRRRDPFERWVLHRARDRENERAVARAVVRSLSSVNRLLGEDRPLLVVFVRRRAIAGCDQQPTALKP